tara:strand:+ start:231 stop:689 length:459 start_codon:yes stop_codon:yes gene_type:complete
MKYRKFTKHEKKVLQAAHVEEALKGEGLYLFENNTNADLTLPRPTKSGCRAVGPKPAQFQGDDYYMQLVRQGHLRLIKVLQTPEQERAVNEGNMEQEKLILDQPDIVTEQGEIEHVINTNTPIQKLDEGDDQPKPDVLLNEAPVDDGFVIVE